MPELPEVETVCRELREKLGASPSVSYIEIFRRDLRAKIPKNIEAQLKGQSIRAIRRRAKYLLFDTEKFTVLSHLGMSGSWRLERVRPHGNEKNLPCDKNKTSGALDNRKKHDHCRIFFDDGQTLIFHDPRRFGLIDLLPLQQEQTSPWLQHLGVEPFDETFTENYLAIKAKGKNIPVKNFIMDQTVVVGVGNIYASESLFLAGVRPTRRLSRIKRGEWSAIRDAIKKVLRSAIENGGTTLRDYRNASGDPGAHQDHLLIYDRTNKPCAKCENSIQSKVISGRSTFWCSQCQV